LEHWDAEIRRLALVKLSVFHQLHQSPGGGGVAKNDDNVGAGICIWLVLWNHGIL
jgi:hypothetical protein